jgi:hypothetical protein
MLRFFSAQDWIRTSTSLRTLPPEGSASTNFATWALFSLEVRGSMLEVLAPQTLNQAFN